MKRLTWVAVSIGALVSSWVSGELQAKPGLHSGC